MSAMTPHQSPQPRPPLRATLEHPAMKAGLGISVTLACYLFPSLFLIIPQAATAQFVNGAYYPLAMTLCAILGFVAFLSLWAVKLVDPGYVEPNHEPLDSNTCLVVDSQPGVYSLPKRRVGWRTTDPNEPYDYAEIEANWRTNPFLYEEFCRQCRVWRSPRTGHCAFCGRCVQRFDHHCGVIGSCVGERNHRFFIIFLVSIGLGSLLMFVSVGIWAFAIPFYNRDRWSDWPPYCCLFFFLLSLYCLMLSFFALFHCLLVSNDRTTREVYGRAHRSWERVGDERRHSLLNRFFRGWSSVCCAPVSLLPHWPFMGISPQSLLTEKQIADYNQQVLRSHMAQNHKQAPSATLPHTSIPAPGGDDDSAVILQGTGHSAENGGTVVSIPISEFLADTDADAVTDSAHTAVNHSVTVNVDTDTARR